MDIARLDPSRDPGVPEHDPYDLATVDSWPELTVRLRALHEHVGRPKYDALSRSSGLAKSAISGMIGVNPLSRPSENQMLRLVGGCLTYAGTPLPDAARELARWRDTWQRLAARPTPTLPDHVAYVEVPVTQPRPAVIPLPAVVPLPVSTAEPAHTAELSRERVVYVGGAAALVGWWVAAALALAFCVLSGVVLAAFER